MRGAFVSGREPEIGATSVGARSRPRERGAYLVRGDFPLELVGDRVHRYLSARGRERKRCQPSSVAREGTARGARAEIKLLRRSDESVDRRVVARRARARRTEGGTAWKTSLGQSAAT